MENTCNESKKDRTYTLKINTIRKKWKRDLNMLSIRKLESNQLHTLCTKLIKEGRLTLDELKASVNSREDLKKILFGAKSTPDFPNDPEQEYNEDEFDR